MAAGLEILQVTNLSTLTLKMIFVRDKQDCLPEGLG